MSVEHVGNTLDARRREFRTAFFARRYEESIRFYRDGLEFRILDSWDRGAADRGTMFVAASGIIEVLARTDRVGEPSPWDERTPQGVMLVVEVDNVGVTYARAVSKGLPLTTELVDQPWGHRSFCVSDPDGLMLYLFQDIR